MFLSPQEQLLVGDSYRRATGLPDRVGANDFMFGAGPDNKGVAVVAGDQNLAVECDGRCAVELGRDGNPTALVDNFSGARVEAGQYSRIAHQVDIVAVEDRRRDISGAFIVSPDDPVGSVEIARAAESNCDDGLARE